MLIQNKPDPSTRSSLVYLLRIWCSKNPEETRFRLEEVSTRQSILFDDIQDLADFLIQQSNEVILGQ